MGKWERGSTRKIAPAAVFLSNVILGLATQDKPIVLSKKVKFLMDFSFTTDHGHKYFKDANRNKNY